MSAYTYIFSKATESLSSPLADHSVLLLVLVSSQAVDDESQPWRDSIGVFETTQGQSPSPILENFDETSHFSFKLIYDQICKTLDKDETIVLLYLLLFRNKSFRIYFLSRTDPEFMVWLG